MPSEIEIVSIHEAGHVAAYLYFGWRCGRVSIYRDRGGTARGDAIAPASRYDARSRGIMCLAGPCAEEKLTGKSTGTHEPDIDRCHLHRSPFTRTGCARMPCARVPTRQGDAAGRLMHATLQRLVDAHERTIADLRARLDRESEERRGLIALLVDRRPWWRRWWR